VRLAAGRDQHESVSFVSWADRAALRKLRYESQVEVGSPPLPIRCHPIRPRTPIPRRTSSASRPARA